MIIRSELRNVWAIPVAISVDRDEDAPVDGMVTVTEAAEKKEMKGTLMGLCPLSSCCKFSTDGQHLTTRCEPKGPPESPEDPNTATNAALVKSEAKAKCYENTV